LSGVLRPSALTPFRVRNFRYQWSGDLLTSWAFEMEILILGWYVLVETNSVLYLSLFGSLLYVGTLVSPLIGVLGDRVGHRIVLCGMRAFYSVLAAALMVLAFTDQLDALVVLVISGLVGLIRPSDLGVRAALVSQTLPPAQLMGAMGVSRTTSDSARIAGALAGAGLFAALGMGPAYVVVTLFYIAGLLLTLQVREPYAADAADAGPLRPARPAPLSDLVQGFVYVWRSPPLLAGMFLAFLVNLSAFPLIMGLLPYVAREIYGLDQTGLGYLAAGFAAGALAGSILLSILGTRIRPGRMMLGYAVAWYVALLFYGHAQDAVTGFIALVVAGFTQSLSLVPLSVMLLKVSSPSYRGLVMGVRMLAIYGLPIGLMGAGAMVDAIGFPTTALLYCSVGLVFTGLIALIWRKHLLHSLAPANAP